MKLLRHLFVAAAAVMVLASAGCTSVSTPATASSAAPAETTATAPASNVYTAGKSSAGLALGTEMQRTADWTLGASVWVMSTDGKPSLSGNPALQVTAIAPNGQKTLMWQLPSKNNVAAQQGGFVLKVPANSVALIVTTGFKSSTSTGTPPALTIPLTEVPVANPITVAGGEPDSF